MRFATIWSSLLLSALLVAAVSGGASSQGAGPTGAAAEKSAPESPAGEPFDKDLVDLRSPEDRKAWVERIRAAYRAVDDAKQREDQAVIGYGKARHKRKTRGAAKREVLQERQESRDAVVEAEAALEEVLAEARRSGVPPGWIREAQSSA